VWESYLYPRERSSFVVQWGSPLGKVGREKGGREDPWVRQAEEDYSLNELHMQGKISTGLSTSYRGQVKRSQQETPCDINRYANERGSRGRIVEGHKKEIKDLNR